ncbi:MAG: hypothetical protein ACI9I0_002669, partial [Rhodoferax sp.]
MPLWQHERGPAVLVVPSYGLAVMGPLAARRPVRVLVQDAQPAR